MQVSKEEKARHMKALWKSLLAPAWTREELIELGKLVFAKIPLADVDEKKFYQLLPKLSAASEALAAELAPQADTSSPAVPDDDPDGAKK